MRHGNDSNSKPNGHMINQPLGGRGGGITDGVCSPFSTTTSYTSKRFSSAQTCMISWPIKLLERFLLDFLVDMSHLLRPTTH